MLQALKTPESAGSPPTSKPAGDLAKAFSHVSVEKKPSQEPAPPSGMPGEAGRIAQPARPPAPEPGAGGASSPGSFTQMFSSFSANAAAEPAARGAQAAEPTCRVGSWRIHEDFSGNTGKQQFARASPARGTAAGAPERGTWRVYANVLEPGLAACPLRRPPEIAQAGTAAGEQVPIRVESVAARGTASSRAGRIYAIAASPESGTVGEGCGTALHSARTFGSTECSASRGDAGRIHAAAEDAVGRAGIDAGGSTSHGSAAGRRASSCVADVCTAAVRGACRRSAVRAAHDAAGFGASTRVERPRRVYAGHFGFGFA